MHTAMIEQLLPAVAAEHHPDAEPAATRLAGMPADEVAQAVIEHRVLGAVGRLADVEPNGGLIETLRGHERFAVMRHLAKVNALRDLSRLLGGISAPWLTFKGPVLAEHVYRDGNRSYDDLDVLVPPEWFPRVVDLLLAEGAHIADRNWPLLRREGRAQLHLVLPDGTALDLHWHMVNFGSVRRTFQIHGEALHARARTISIGGMEIPTFGTEDAIVQLALHATISGGHKLVWLKDLEQTILHDPPAWDRVVEIAHAQGTGLAVAASLSRAGDTLAAPLPRDVLRALAPGVVAQRILGMTTTWRPRGRLPGGGSLDRSVLHSLRGTRAGTASALTRRAWLMMQRQVDTHPYWLDPADPRNLQFADGGDAGRAAYLADVSRVKAESPGTV